MSRLATPLQDMALRAQLVGRAMRLLRNHCGTAQRSFHAARGLRKHWAYQASRIGPSPPIRLDSGWLMRPMIPRLGTPALDRWLEGMISRFSPESDARPSIQVAFLSITRRCGLSCQHCSAWDELDQRERMNKEQLVGIVHALQDFGVGQIQFTGGEPMARFEDLVTILEASKENSDFWISTSGMGLTPSRASRLAEAGLVGVYLSIDHTDPKKHDVFRGKEGCFEQAEKAAEACLEAGLGLAISLCPTRDFVTERQLESYYRMAWDMGAFCIRITEPKAVGRWSGEEVTLEKRHKDTLDRFLLKANNGELGPGPVLFSPDFISRQLGCVGNGLEAIYVDSEGMVRGCPFCSSEGANVSEGVDLAIKRLRERACTKFNPEEMDRRNLLQST
jgi:MoaA/NifB/PqqE/SkfB family radical SAM enzyme